MAQKASDFPVKQKQLNEDISNGLFKNCYLIYGDEAYLRLQNRDKLLKALGCDSSSMNFNRYEGEACSPAAIIDMAETMPFLADKRVILVQNSGFFKDGCPELADYLKKPADTALLIFVEKEVDRRKDIYKAVAKSGFDIECVTQDEVMLKKWVASKFRSEGKSISAQALARLIEHVGTDMSNISTEIEKLVCFCIDKSEISVEDIDAVCANYLTGRIFAMTDAISAQNQKQAMELYYDLLALKEPPAKILALITRQFNIMLQVKEMTQNRKSSADIAGSVKIAPFLVGKYQGWARNYSYSQLKDALTYCVSNDEAVKKGRLDYKISVEMVIIKCTSMKKTG